MTAPLAPSLTRRLALATGGLYLLLRVGHLLRWDLWFDELFGVGLGYLGWGQLLARAASDQTNPPLFYLLIKGWMGLGGDSPAWLRLLPLLIAAVALIPIGRLLRTLQWRAEIQLATLWLVALSPFLIFYAVEIRAYALLFVLATAALSETATLILDDESDRRALIRLTCWNTLIVLTHYFGWFVVAAEGIAFLTLGRPRWRLIFATGIPPVLGFLPWAYAVVSAARASHTVAPTIAWIPRPTAGVVAELPAFLLGADLPWLIVIAAGVTVAALVLGFVPRAEQPPRERTATRLLAIAALTPILFAIAASWILPRSIWVPRNLIVSALPLLALLVLALDRLGRRAMLAGMTLLSLLAVRRIVTSGNAKTHWSALAEALAATTPDTAAVYTFESYTALPLRFYAFEDGARIAVQMAHVPDDLHAREGWVIARDSAWPGGPGGANALQEWGFTVTDSLVTGAKGERIRAWKYRR